MNIREGLSLTAATAVGTVVPWAIGSITPFNMWHPESTGAGFETNSLVEFAAEWTEGSVLILILVITMINLD